VTSDKFLVPIGLCDEEERGSLAACGHDLSHMWRWDTRIRSIIVDPTFAGQMARGRAFLAASIAHPRRG
jgi:hypothetical protein